MKDEDIIEILKKENEDFKKVYLEHRDLDGKLNELDKKHYLSTDEDMERKKMQKEKLHKKDKMAEFVRDYKKQHP
ncbi:MAG: DUF465 domain-containing protein [Nitrospirae bacterium]|nr:MAG: DUF465 domain-containing protein [Nitrospirota bacterium]